MFDKELWWESLLCTCTVVSQRVHNMKNYSWSAELQQGNGQKCCSKHLRVVACAAISGVASALLAASFLVAWLLYDSSGDGSGAISDRLKIKDFSTADWERIISDSGPLNYGWEKGAV